MAGTYAAAGQPPTDEQTPDSIVDAGDRLYVLTHGSYITLEADDLVVRKRNKEVCRRPLAGIGLLFLQGMAMNVSVALQVRLAEADVPIVLAPPFGEPLAVLNSLRSSKSNLRGLQVLRRDDPDVVRTGLEMLAAKIGNQAALLKYFAKYRRRIDEELADSMTAATIEMGRLAALLQELDPAGGAVRSLAMGYEGNAASIYWRQLSRLAPVETLFEGRVTRHARDVVNQCLNYVYGMLYGEVWRAVCKAGLDPYFGLIHGSKRDQGSLVFDLIEEFRAPFADRVVLGLLGRGFRPEQNSEGLLRTRTRRVLAKRFSKGWTRPVSWRSRSMPPARILEEQACALGRLFSREDKYRPFRMRW